ncbi:MAG: YegS/Rv2252/BmrU family lipid kinase [Melioribacteraceae bacterium]|nr:MAG: YegS/Rv2252/BmrU family lipid kinase [Melioribacteraceae bacterium]
MNKYAFIINPVAGKIKKLNAARLIEEHSKLFDVSVKIFFTSTSGHAIKLSNELTSSNEYNTIVAVGGDGTVNEVVNGFNLDSDCRLGVLPWGSGNDVARFLYPSNTKNYLDILFEEKLQTIAEINVGNCKITQDDETIVQKRFINAVGIGFDAYVAYLNQFEKKFSGILSYLVAVMRGLKSLETLEPKILLNGQILEGKYLLLTIGNGKTSGGGFYLNPDANPTDGILNLTTVDMTGKIEIMKNLPYALINKLKLVKKAKFYEDDEFKITLKNPYYVHLDGEIGSKSAKEFNIRLLQKSIKIIKSK